MVQSGRNGNDLSADWHGPDAQALGPPKTAEGEYRKEVIAMMLKKTASLVFAATCLSAIATTPADAQAAGSYASPSYNGTHNGTPQANQGGCGTLGSAPECDPEPALTIAASKQIASSGKRACARNAVRSPIPNSVKAAVRASVETSHTPALQPRAGSLQPVRQVNRLAAKNRAGA